jgi:hypothetical protein
MGDVIRIQTDDYDLCCGGMKQHAEVGSLHIGIVQKTSRDPLSDKQL